MFVSMRLAFSATVRITSTFGAGIGFSWDGGLSRSRPASSKTARRAEPMATLPASCHLERNSTMGRESPHPPRFFSRLANLPEVGGRIEEGGLRGGPSHGTHLQPTAPHTSPGAQTRRHSLP